MGQREDGKKDRKTETLRKEGRKKERRKDRQKTKERTNERMVGMDEQTKERKLEQQNIGKTQKKTKVKI